MESRFALTMTVIGLSCEFLVAEVSWRNGDRLPPAMGPASIHSRAAQIKARHAQGGPSEQHVLIQFAEAVTATERRALEEKGVRLLQPLSAKAFFATVDASKMDAGALGEKDHLNGLHQIQRNWKLHPGLLAGNPPPWCVVSRKADGQTPDKVAAYVILYPDVSWAKLRVDIINRYNLIVRSEIKAINCVVVEMPAEKLNLLADEDVVSWIEPPLPPLAPTNDSNRALTQANIVQAAPYNLNGAGVNVLVYDGGNVDITHPGFGGRAVLGEYVGYEDHPTHVAGTIGGNGANSPSGTDYRGMAPGVTIQSYSFPVEPVDSFLYGDLGDLEDDYQAAIANGAVLANNSIGTNVAFNRFPCDWEGNYGATDVWIDSMVRGSLETPPMRIVWAAGNERSSANCGGDTYHKTAPPANAKNHICVGAVNSNDDSMTDFSSWGPSDDGRLKPDIVAPGCQSNDDNAVTSTVVGGGYEAEGPNGLWCGTSMAAPTVTGLCALLIQDHLAQFPTMPLPRNSTLKALLAHNAVDLGNPGPDYQVGYGSVRIKDTIDFMRRRYFKELPIVGGQTLEFQIAITQQDVDWGMPIKVTMAWDDPPAALNVSTQLVNDLDVEIWEPNGTVRHYPWTLDPANPSLPAVQDRKDSLNNIEQVFVSGDEVAAGGVGTWVVKIKGTTVEPLYGDQWFSFCASPNLDCQLKPGDADCNGNGIKDSCELDCNGSGAPDDCDVDPSDPDGDGTVYPDCNNNGRPDSCDLAMKSSYDCFTADGIPDECQDAWQDDNGNNRHDLCEIADGEHDCDLNQVLDSVQIAADPGLDADQDGLLDTCDTIYVDASTAVPQKRNGDTWNRAYGNLQDALDDAKQHANERKYIYIADGTYTTGESGFVLDGRSGLTIMGGFQGCRAPDPMAREIDSAPSILTRKDGTNQSWVLSFQNCEDVTLDGVTIADAKTSGGLRLVNSRGEIRNCRIAGNKGRTGTGVRVENCPAGITILNSIIVGNGSSAIADGGGVYVGVASRLRLVNSVVATNIAGVGSISGGVSSFGPTDIVSSILWGNQRYIGIYSSDGTPLGTPLGADVTGAQLLVGHANQCHVVYSNVEGGWMKADGERGSLYWGTGNIDRDPLFGDPDGPDNDALSWRDNNYRLQVGSPCIDRGAPGEAPSTEDYDRLPRVQKGVIDMGPFESEHAQDCNSNSIDDTSSEEVDCNGNRVPDGCELALDRDWECPDCPTDCNANGIPDTCEDIAYAAADLDHDCDVDMEDFSFVQVCALLQTSDPIARICPVESWPGCTCSNCDLDGDSDVDVDDMSWFISLVENGSAMGPGICAASQCPASGGLPGDQDIDGILDDLDNCPGVANDDQVDGDTDGAGDACDNCAVANSDQADVDADGIGDVCDDDRDGDGVANAADNCPDHYDPGQWDMDADGVGDLCDPDMDGDGIPDDWDGDGSVDSPCTAGNTTDCDDNCPYDVNPDQADWDADGEGNACDGTPGEPPEGGEGMLVVDPLAMNSAGEGMTQDVLPVPAQGAMAYFVTHDGASTTVNLPATAGTVSVDLVVAAAGPLDVWEVTPAVTAANVVSIDATGWSQEGELLAWTAEQAGETPAPQLPSRYNCGELYWIIVSPQGQAVCQAWAGPICAERLLTPGARALTGSYGLDAVAGPINTPAGTVFTTASPLGAITSRPIQARAARVATLTLNVAGVPGTYQLTLTNGTCYSASAAESSQLLPGPAFEVRVGRE